MIKKASLVLISSLMATSLIVGCTSSDEDTKQNKAFNTNSDPVQITVDNKSGIKTVNGISVSMASLAVQNNNALNTNTQDASQNLSIDDDTRVKEYDQSALTNFKAHQHQFARSTLEQNLNNGFAQFNLVHNASAPITWDGASAYDPHREYGSLWNSDLFRDERFKMNIKLSKSEKAEAKILARSFEAHMERSKMFMHYLLSELKARNLPAELAAVPLVESGFNPRAKSHAGAHGPWQFTRQTGKSFGLEVTAKYDEFYDFIASTNASLSYLEHLYKALGNNWELALIAYNQGEFGVKRAIRKAKANGVTKITPENLQLTNMARTYLKRVRAYADILHHPEAYGVEHPYIENRVAFKRVQIGGRLNSMKEAARLAGVELKTLQHLNAGFLTDSLNTNKQRGLLVPIENARRLERAIGIEQVVEQDRKLSLSSLPSNISIN